MAILSENDKQLILDLAVNKIELDEFYERYSVNISADHSYVLRMLELAEQAQDAETIEYLTYLRGYHRDVEPKHIHCEIFRRLLLEEWHHSHEYMIDALWFEKDTAVFPVLVQRALGTLPQLDELDDASLRKRSVYAIAKIGGDSAIEALKDLAERGSKQVRETAQKCIQDIQNDAKYLRS